MGTFVFEWYVTSSNAAFKQSSHINKLTLCDHSRSNGAVFRFNFKFDAAPLTFSSGPINFCLETLLTPNRIRTHPAEEVYVTGTFDNWSKSEKLVKTGDVFTKDVTLPSADEKIYYKVRVGERWKDIILSI
jgi:hypothetical protein